MKEKVWSTPIIATFTLFCPREGRLKHKLRSRTSISGSFYGDQFSNYGILIYRVLKLADDNILFKCLLLGYLYHLISFFLQKFLFSCAVLTLRWAFFKFVSRGNTRSETFSNSNQILWISSTTNLILGPVWIKY